MDERFAVGACNVHIAELSVPKRGGSRFEFERDSQASREKVHRAGGKYRKRLVASHQLAGSAGNRAVATTDHDDVAVAGERLVKRVLDFIAGYHGHHHLMTRFLHRLAQARREGCEVECTERSAFSVEDDLEAHVVAGLQI